MKINVIIPTYNGEQWIADAIASVFVQYSDTEIVICDDLSTDNTLKIAEKFGCTILKNKKHSGCPNQGRNLGIIYSRGKCDYVAFLDQDDIWLVGKLKCQITVLKDFNQDVAYSAYTLKDQVIDPHFIITDTDIFKELQKYKDTKNGIYTSSMLIKNENIPLFKVKFSEYQWLYDLVKDRKCARTVPVVIRRLHGNNLSLTETYRLSNYKYFIQNIDNRKIRKNATASLARYYYVEAKYKKARYYFLKADFTLKNIAYFITSFVPLIARRIVKKYKVFG